MFTYKGKEYFIDGYLAMQLDTLIYNVKKDYDFVILITGDRTVRVGKSVLAMTICAYLSMKMNSIKMENRYEIKDIYFDNKDMMAEAFKKPKYHINHYDEGREGLAANKAMKSMQQDLLDFFAECGQLNHIFVIVAPDFFKLSEEIAVARSEFLINVYRKETPKMIDLYKTGKKIPVVSLDRGRFEFFSRKRKQTLYDKATSTRRKSYGLVKADFTGSFSNQYPLGEEEYREAKKEALSRFTEKKEKEKENKEALGKRAQNKIMQLRKMVGALTDKMSHKDIKEVEEGIGEKYGIGKDTIYKLKLELKEDLASEDIEKAMRVRTTFKMPQDIGGGSDSD